jgi:hypothetical protein
MGCFFLWGAVAVPNYASTLFCRKPGCRKAWSMSERSGKTDGFFKKSGMDCLKYSGSRG